MSRAFCVCVPARDEAARLPALLAALAAQAGVGRMTVALCVNNSRDGSAEAARAAAARHGDRLALHVDERAFPAPLAHAGSARRAAMELGAALLADDGAVLVSTDADCRPPPGWIAAILAVIADDRIVGGRIVLDRAEPLGPRAAAARAAIDRYWAAVRAIEDAIDPVPWDPPPRHGDHTGASLALAAGLYARAGGVPPVPCGEDRALVENARAAGGRLVHPETVWTRVSPRRDGRAPGGMATAMAALDAGPPLLPDLEHWRERAAWRRSLRGRGEAAIVAAERRLPPMPCDMNLAEFAA